MANFFAYLPLLLQVEGLYQNNASDQGNYNSLGQLVGTNYGISARFYEDVIGRPPSQQDMLAINRDKAIDIYKTYFWDRHRASEIQSQSVANTVIDMEINSGNGVRMAQRLLNSDFGKNLSVDGVIGPKTLTAINSVNANLFVEKYNAKRKDWYLTRSNSDVFGAGWINRLTHFVADNPTTFGIGTVLTVGGIVYLLTRKLWHE